MKQSWQQAIFEVSIRKKEKWAWARLHLEDLLKPSSVCLDVGSGVGTLSQLQEEMGGSWEFTETDEAAAQETRNVVRGPVHTVDVFDSSLTPGTYDVITIFDVIEHVPDPAAFMRRVSELLRAGGYVILTTPADDGTYYFWRRLAESLFGITKESHGHVVEGFSPSQLRQLSSAAGLQIQSIEPFSFAFTEMVELLYNGAYTLKNRSRQQSVGYNLTLSPASHTDLNHHRAELTALRIVYPLLRGVSLLDHILPVSRGYEWGMVARKK